MDLTEEGSRDLLTQLKAGKKASFDDIDRMRSFLQTPEGKGLLKFLGVEGFGVRAVQKRGIQFEGAWFIAPEMEDYIGQSIQVEFDPTDKSRIYVFDIDGEFAFIAECPEQAALSKF